MDIFITGGSGFVGRQLCEGLMQRDHRVTVLARSQGSAARLPTGVAACLGDPTQPGDWQKEAARHQGFINLAGASIFGRWSPEYKDLLRTSRILSTQNLVQAIASRESDQPATLISASAVGYYGFRGDEELDEAAPAGDDFLAMLCQDWEARAQQAEAAGARVVRARFGIVLGPGGGALAQMLPLFRLGLGGPLGSGRQWFSWIHGADLVAALIFCLEREGLSGAVNCTAPQPARNRELAGALGRALKRPAFLPAPAFAIRLAMGEFGSVLLEGQRVLPRVLEKSGFAFAFPDLDAALADLL